MARFSIITICYNSEKTIERTIKSVLAQTCKDYEYIIVDGTDMYVLSDDDMVSHCYWKNDEEILRMSARRNTGQDFI